MRLNIAHVILITGLTVLVLLLADNCHGVDRNTMPFLPAMGVTETDFRLTFPGSLSLTYDQSAGSVDNERLDGRFTADFEQAIRFVDFPDWQPFVGLSLYKPNRKVDDNYWRLGVRSFMLLEDTEIGFEKQFAKDLMQDAENRYVGYITYSIDWE